MASSVAGLSRRGAYDVENSRDQRHIKDSSRYYSARGDWGPQMNRGYTYKEPEEDEPKPCCGGRLDRAVACMPRHGWLVVMFCVLIAIMMGPALASYFVYHDAAQTDTTSQWHGWVGCTVLPNTVVNNQAANQTVDAVLSRFKGIQDTSLNEDLGEDVLTVVEDKKYAQYFKPVCPRTNEAGVPLSSEETPFIKITFILTTIQPELASATADVQIQVWNSLDLRQPSRLNSSSANGTVKFRPDIESKVMVPWPDNNKTIAGVKLPLITEKPITNYPWDRYYFQRIMWGEVLVYNNTPSPSVRKLPLQIWTQTTTQQFEVSVSTQYVDANTNKATPARDRVFDDGMNININVERSFFTKGYSIVVVVLMWIIAGLNLMHCLDNVFVRPRDIKDAIAATLLFSLPGFRNTMPGVPQAFGVAIDMIGIVWAELMVAFAVMISFIAFLGQYTHASPFFHRKKSEKESGVTVERASTMLGTGVETG